MTTFLLVLGIYALYFAGAIVVILVGYTLGHFFHHRRDHAAARRVEVDFDRVIPITAARSYDRTRGAA